MDLTHGSLPRLMRQIAMPAVTGMFLQTVLNVTGTWMAGQISTLAQAALALSFPMFFMLISFGVGLSRGGSTLLGHSLGAGDLGKINKLAGQLLILGIVLGFGISFFGPLVLKPAFVSMGATEGAYLDMSMDYMGTIFIFSPIFVVNYVLNSFLTSQGDSRSMRNALAVAAVLNIPLAWWLAKGSPGLGVTGLALAAVLVQCGVLVYLGYRVSRTCIFRGGFWSSLKLDLKLQKEISGQALPPALNQGSVGVGIYIISWFVGSFGPEAIAGYGVAIRFEQIALLPAFGLSIAILPLTAQNDGAGNFGRALEIRSLALRWGAYISVVPGFLLFFCGYFLTGLLSSDETVRREGAWMLKFSALTFFAYLVLYINVAFLQGLERPMFAVWIGLYRQIIAPLVVFWFLVFVLDMGITGLWLGVCLVSVSGAVITEYYVRRIIAARLDHPHPQGRGGGDGGI